MKITILTTCLLAFLFTFSTQTFAADATVNLTTDQHDTNPGDGICAVAGGGCSLRAAVEEANQPSVNSITRILFNLPQFSTITLTTGNGGEIQILKSVDITGPGAYNLTIDGGAGTNRIFYVSTKTVNNTFVRINGVTLTGGDGGGANSGSGGAILVYDSTLELYYVHIKGNSASYGGGVAFLENTHGLISHSTISGNTASTGGGVYNGFVFYKNWLLKIFNSTISGNSAWDGGGLYNEADATLRNVTITNNSSPYTNDGFSSTFKGGGGINQRISNGSSQPSTLRLGNTIVAGNLGRSGYLNPFEIQFASGTIISEGGNLIGDSAGDSTYTGVNAVAYHPTDIRDVNPRLGTLGYASGYTPTQSLLAGSPAIDSGINSLAVYTSCTGGYPYTCNENTPLEFDQRGYGNFLRFRDGNGDGTSTVDIGAYEYQSNNGANTQAGANSTVQSSTGDASVSFSQVTTTGTTTFTPITPSSAGTPPQGYTILNNAPAYDITTTASYTPPVTVCFRVSSISDQAQFSRVRILHGEGGQLVDRTILSPDTPAPDFATRTVCARVNSLSPFVVAQINSAPPSVSIAGTVTYGTTPAGQPTKFVPGVVLNATGTSSSSAVTNSFGAYSLANLISGGTYTVTPSKSGDVNSISSTDASLVARRSANLISLTANQMLAADVSNNGSVSSFDASMIARKAAGLTTSIGVAGQWKFVPASRSYPSLTADQSNQNYEAILMV